jgi:hypothetical protein
LSYPHLFKAQKNERNEDRYSTALLLPPEYDLKPLVDALQRAFVEKFGAEKAKWPRQCRKPSDVIQPAEEKYGSAFAGWHFINASSGTPPGVCNAAVETVQDPSAVYPGRWAKIAVAAFGYDNKTKGVTLGLNNVQLLRNDEPLAGKPRPQDVFDVVAEEMGVNEDWG